MPNPRLEGAHAPMPATSARRAPEMRDSLSSGSISPLIFDRTRSDQALRVDATAGGDRNSEASGIGEQNSGNGDLDHLEGDITAVADDLRADLDELLFQGCQRSVCDRLGRCQCS